MILTRWQVQSMAQMAPERTIADRLFELLGQDPSPRFNLTLEGVPDAGDAAAGPL